MTQALPYSTSCFVCGRDNERGLRLRFTREGEWVTTRCTLHRDFNGFFDRTHGGIIASVLDETMAWATVVAGGRFTYTVELSLRYKLPVPVAEEIEARARVTRDRRRLAETYGEIRTRTGDLLVTAEGKFMYVTAEETRAVADGLIYEPDVWRGLEGEDED